MRKTKRDIAHVCDHSSTTPGKTAFGPFKKLHLQNVV
jgi:hypothetical protein